MRNKFSLVAFFALLAVPRVLSQKQKRDTGPPIVKLNYATLIGSSSDGVDSFLDIPFAKPPINELRFSTPQFPDHHLGTLNVTQPGQNCYRVEHTLTLQGTEDCLRLDLVRPSAAESKDHGQEGLPVMFFMHG
jgi:carboxylesterase type B